MNVQVCDNELTQVFGNANSLDVGDLAGTLGYGRVYTGPKHFSLHRCLMTDNDFISCSRLFLSCDGLIMATERPRYILWSPEKHHYWLKYWQEI